MTTVYDVLKSLAKYDGSPDAHDMVIADCKKYAGKTVSKSAAWCSETVGAALAAAGKDADGKIILIPVGGRIMTEVILISCAFILGGIFGMVLINFM